MGIIWINGSASSGDFFAHSVNLFQQIPASTPAKIHKPNLVIWRSGVIVL
jgi:hypothetical protein